jgi:hypothetical protein
VIRDHGPPAEGAVSFHTTHWTIAESRYRLEPVVSLTAEKIFDAPWALNSLGGAMTPLREEYVVQDKSSPFETLKIASEGRVGP